jgi:acetyl/propionyl-CoA carboxylase alpha subunit
MNTRLQVEHPVTELVTGLDLVGLQFAVAQGEVLPFRQSDVDVHGHAIEARVYAEDPFHHYLPQAGVAEVVRWPTRARVDAALESGQRVGTSYDPMLGKIIASGATREAARRALVTALDDTAILGLTSNVGFLRQLVASTAFRDSSIDTGWLDAHPDQFALSTPVPAWCLAAWSVAAARTADPSRPFGAGDGWRLGAPPSAVPIELTAPDGDTRLLRVDLAAGLIAGPHAVRDVTSLGEIDGTVRLQIETEVHEGRVLLRPHEVLVAYRGQTYAFVRPDAFGPGRSRAVTSGTITAPMPGTMLAVNVSTGTSVTEGEALGVMEAMKMELALRAPFTGTVTEVDVAAGDLVDLGARLFLVTPEDPS